MFVTFGIGISRDGVSLQAGVNDHLVELGTHWGEQHSVAKGTTRRKFYMAAEYLKPQADGGHEVNGVYWPKPHWYNGGA